MFSSLQSVRYSLVVLMMTCLWWESGTAQSSTFPPVGDATITGNDCYHLTTPTPYILGAVWFDPQVDLNQPFDIRVKMNFGNIFLWDGSNTSNIYPEAGGGADGIAFVMQQVSSAAGNLGEAMGYGLLTPSISVEFDSYYNFNADPLYDHIAISKNGDHVHTQGPYGNYSQGTIIPGSTVVPALGTDPVADNIHTGNDYEVRFKWDPATTELDVWFDCQHKFTFTEDIVNTIFAGNSNVFYGFTSATGSEFNDHTVCMIYNSVQHELPDTSICQGQSVQLDATLPNVTPGSTTYSWSPATGLSDPNIANPVATPNVSTTYVVTIQQGCYADPIVDSLQITVGPGTPINIDPAGPYCINSPDVNLTSNAVGGQWAGTGITDTQNGVFSPQTAGVGTHQVIQTIGGSCGGSDTISIIVYDTPTPVFSADTLYGCAPLTVTFTNETNPPGTDCLWDFGDGTTVNDCGQVTHTYTQVGCFDVSLTITGGDGCIGTTTILDMICTTGSPDAQFSYSPNSIEIPNTLVQFQNLSTGSDIYHWNFAGLGTSTDVHPQFEFPSQYGGDYQVCLTATTIDGCVDEECQIIVIGEEMLIYVPNAFTPDGDVFNNVFQPVVSGVDPTNYQFYVFNRWGQLIYEGHHPTSFWDGSYKGAPSQQDVYVWKIVCRGNDDTGKHEYIGHVSLIR